MIMKRGYVGDGKYKTREGNSHTPEYEAWRKIFTRCYDPAYILSRPTYEGCSVCREWHNFQSFAEWYKDNYYQANHERMEIDKDIIVKGNKVYAPDRCVFVPQRINSLFLKRDRRRGDYPIGVSLPKRGKRFLARCHDGFGNLIRLGVYDTPYLAFRAYKEFKEQVIKNIAYLYRDKTPEKLFNALISYTVEITD
jgi:hypothetical protein